MEERLEATAYIIPTELVAMINVLVEAKVQSHKLCTDGGDQKSDENSKPKKVKQDIYIPATSWDMIYPYNMFIFKPLYYVLVHQITLLLQFVM